MLDYVPREASIGASPAARAHLPVERAMRLAIQDPERAIAGGEAAEARNRHGFDFGNVRVHAGPSARSAAASIGARAFSVGGRIVLGAEAEGDGPGPVAIRRHELIHIAQQARAGGVADRPVVGRSTDSLEREAREGRLPASSIPVPLVQRDERVGPGTGGPSDWSARVAGAQTSGGRAALLAESTGLPVVDRTRESAGDRSPTSGHLVEFTADSRTINYDDDLTRKESPVDHRPLSANAGYTLSTGSHFYIVLGRQALDGDDFFASRVTVNHEFDHVRQIRAGSSLRGNESELDAWTSTFIREFHRRYTIWIRRNACYVDRVPGYEPLRQYFARSDVSDRERQRAVERIVQYHATMITGNRVHEGVFRRWIRNSLQGSSPDLAIRLNVGLHLNVDPADAGTAPRAIDCAAVSAGSFAAAPAVGDPFVAATGPASAGSGGEGHLGLEIRGGVSLDPGAPRLAASLAARYSLRSDRMLVLNPTIGAQLLYLPASGPNTEHVAAAIAELGLRIQRPLTGAYGDVRAGGFLGLGFPTAPRTDASTDPHLSGGFSGAVGVGYRWERLELGVEGRALVGSDSTRFVVLGVRTLRF
jgi:hypothetical protein